jgi:hypothetical protein
MLDLSVEKEIKKSANPSHPRSPEHENPRIRKKGKKILPGQNLEFTGKAAPPSPAAPFLSIQCASACRGTGRRTGQWRGHRASATAEGKGSSSVPSRRRVLRRVCWWQRSEKGKGRGGAGEASQATAVTVAVAGAAPAAGGLGLLSRQRAGRVTGVREENGG